MRMLHFAQKMVIISCIHLIICMRSLQLTHSFQLPGSGRFICILYLLFWVAYAFANCNTESIHLMISKTIVWSVLESGSRR